MSLRQLQTRNFLEAVTSSYLASGKKPTDAEIYKALNFYFSQQPAGSPILLSPDLFIRNAVPNVEDFNDFMASIQVNLDVLFEQLDLHLEQNISLNTALTAQIKTLRTKRKRLESKIDDILSGIYNVDGFFYSFSDSFYDGTLVDFDYTDAFLDVESGSVALPTNSDGTRLLNLSGSNAPNIGAFERLDINSPISYIEESNFSNAVDGLTNTAWYITIRKEEPSDGVFVKVALDVGTSINPTEITQIAITPHGVEPVQCAVKKLLAEDQNFSVERTFSSSIKKSSDKMLFVNDEKDNGISKIIIELSKPLPDYYEDNVRGTRTGVYIIGMKELMLTKQTYTNEAVLVTQPFGIDESLVNDQVIGSVSLTTRDSKPPNTGITYFVASDNPNATSVFDFDWTEIEPVSPNGEVSGNSVINMGGAYREEIIYRKTIKEDTDTELIPINLFTTDPEFQNPSPAMFSDFEVYRIGRFESDFLSGTLSLEEGVNSTRILHTAYSTENIDNTFSFWKAKLEDESNYETAHGEVDTGNGFFYGADIGENERSVYIETFVYSDFDNQVELEEIVKSNPNSKLWSIKAFVNGREVADMPVGVDKVSAPVKINKGKNAIIMAINIPPASASSLVPYIGSVAFNLLSHGIIKLGDYAYVDNYKFEDNGYRDTISIFPNKWFTIHNNEIVTRSKITDNYRLRFATPTGSAPDKIRIKAEMKSFVEGNVISPTIDSYRVRFSYQSKDDGTTNG